MSGGLDNTLAALADPTRRAIVTRLAHSDATVSELVGQFPLAQPTISKHLKVLERAGLVTRRREGTKRPCHLESRALEALEIWLFDQRLERQRSMDRLSNLPK